MSRLYQKTPSELLGLSDEYTSYCLNEACAYIISKIDNGEEPAFKKKYKSFTDLYAQLDS